jgi:secretion/DNA translocation related TadE-like protein
VRHARATLFAPPPGRRRLAAHHPHSRDVGSISIWVLSFAMLTLAVATVVGVRTTAVLARHRAEAAADLAALAAAARIGLGPDACRSAARLASANAAVLRDCRVDWGPDGRTGAVTVRVAAVVRLPIVGAETVTASARAGRLPGARPAAARWQVAGQRARQPPGTGRSKVSPEAAAPRSVAPT